MLQSIKFLSGKCRGAGFVRLLRHYTTSNDVSSVGRSMIEMLGVLAIIGVLSVGGIAGYSKAMEKFKINKTINDYHYLILGLLEHLDSIKNAYEHSTKDVDYNELIYALNLKPASWNMKGEFFYDDLGNRTEIFSFAKSPYIRFSIYVGGQEQSEKNLIAPGFKHQTCVTLIKDLIQPMHSTLQNFVFFRSNQTYEIFYGDEKCVKDRKCLSDMTISEINAECKTCMKNEMACSLAIDF